MPKLRPEEALSRTPMLRKSPMPMRHVPGVWDSYIQKWMSGTKEYNDLKEVKSNEDSLAGPK